MTGLKWPPLAIPTLAISTNSTNACVRPTTA